MKQFLKKSFIFCLVCLPWSLVSSQNNRFCAQSPDQSPVQRETDIKKFLQFTDQYKRLRAVNPIIFECLRFNLSKQSLKDQSGTQWDFFTNKLRESESLDDRERLKEEMIQAIVHNSDPDQVAQNLQELTAKIQNEKLNDRRMRHTHRDDMSAVHVEFFKFKKYLLQQMNSQ